MQTRVRRSPSGARLQVRPGRLPVVPAVLATIVMVVAACGSAGPTPPPIGAASAPVASLAPAATLPAATLPAATPGESDPTASLQAPSPETARAARIPVVVCPTSFGLPDESMPPVPSTMTATVSPEVAAQVTFYGNGMRTLLGPKGWICEAAVGADGSSSMTITPPGQPTPEGSPLPDHQAVTAFTGGACVGCIATMACGLFPEAWKLFEYDDLACPTTTPAGELVTRPMPRLAIFEDPPGVAGTGEPSGGRYRALGLMVFDPGTGAAGTDQDFPSALKITCTLPDTMAQVCDEIVEGAR
jgi:hypothetical protein